ncbi:MAG TPA: HPr(Ser) kinase/phosphatase [Gammaproteobacteria bacterium]|nr:HPr(Ser) kinase/phosphatase [Gammaproteobacteria bacterium]
MSTQLTVDALFETLQTQLAFTWVAGHAGKRRTLRYLPGDDSNDISLVGHLNFIHPHRIQLIGQTELSYLDNLRKNSRKDTITQLFSDHSDLVIFCENQPVPDDIRQRADATPLPVLTSSLPSQEIINHLQHYYGHQFAQRVTLHGVFMEVIGSGVLITGDPSVGKSELALELVSRGHRLIADDSPEFSRVAPEEISGTCPELLRDFLEVRGLGILNIRAMFGDSAIKQTKYLRLVIHLEKMGVEQIKDIDRLRGSRRTREILGVQVPEITLPVAPGRNLAVMVEAAARTHILARKGYDASQVFIERQQRQIEKNAT